METRPIDPRRASRLEKIAHRPQAPLAALVVLEIKGGAVAGSFATGRRFISADGRSSDLPAGIETRYRVASISKWVTAIGAMRLVEAGHIALEEDISPHLGFRFRHPAFPETAITLAMLLSHTSSLRDGVAYSMPIPHTLREFFDPDLDSPYYENGGHWGSPPPGGFFCYCNLNYGVVGTLIERLSGRRFDHFMRETIFEPLAIDGGYNVAELSPAALAHLGVIYRRQPAAGSGRPGRWEPQVDDWRGQRPPPLAIIESPDTDEDYRRDFGHIRASSDLAAYEIGSNGTLFSPQGGLRISALDLARLLRAFVRPETAAGRPLLQPETIGLMQQTRWRYDPASSNGDPYGGLMRAWGLGLQVFTAAGDRGASDRLLAAGDWRPWGHLGDAYGLLSGLLFDEKGDGLIYLIGGVGRHPSAYPGRYSTLSRWEEDLLTAVLA